MESKTVLVIGAGVQGLTSALLLLHQGVKSVTIVAEASPSDYQKRDPTYASPKAGANWQTYAGNTDYRLQEYDELTYKALWELSVLPECGIMRLPGFEFYNEKPAALQHPWYARFVRNYGFATAADLPPGKQFGVKYDTFTMNVPKYLAWLTGRVKALGGKLVFGKRLEHWQDALSAVPGGKVDIVVNCTGLGALTLGGVEDKDCYPVRGQTILVRAPQVKRTIGTSLALGGTRAAGGKVEEEMKVTYVIPREDGIVILGGTYQKHNGSMEINADSASDIMTRCIGICPELVVNGKLPEIVEHSVGLRPARYGDCRLDSQYLKTSSGREVLFVNNYGHGGYGYQSSWGCAYTVAKMVRRAIGCSQNDSLLSQFVKEVVGSKSAKL
ncbi:hypothetical protein HDU78_002242 [Chytriomyces hyalinus]|nr:hypothetical protein HDU78_002242 [Chytriomyces hyalinus]KAJ3259772.1 hypothetical protein HDU77_001641 [Chytriomyces hyalinus]